MRFPQMKPILFDYQNSRILHVMRVVLVVENPYWSIAKMLILEDLNFTFDQKKKAEDEFVLAHEKM
jgi:hypothetical protein